MPPTDIFKKELCNKLREYEYVGLRMSAKTFFRGKRGWMLNPCMMCLPCTRRVVLKLRWKDINPTVKNALEKRQDRIKVLKKLYKSEMWVILNPS